MADHATNTAITLAANNTATAITTASTTITTATKAFPSNDAVNNKKNAPPTVPFRWTRHIYEASEVRAAQRLHIRFANPYEAVFWSLERVVPDKSGEVWSDVLETFLSDIGLSEPGMLPTLLMCHAVGTDEAEPRIFEFELAAHDSSVGSGSSDDQGNRDENRNGNQNEPGKKNDEINIGKHNDASGGAKDGGDGAGSTSATKESGSGSPTSGKLALTDIEDKAIRAAFMTFVVGSMALRHKSSYIYDCSVIGVTSVESSLVSQMLEDRTNGVRTTDAKPEDFVWVNTVARHADSATPLLDEKKLVVAFALSLDHRAMPNCGARNRASKETESRRDGKRGGDSYDNNNRNADDDNDDDEEEEKEQQRQEEEYAHIRTAALVHLLAAIDLEEKRRCTHKAEAAVGWLVSALLWLTEGATFVENRVVVGSCFRDVARIASIFSTDIRKDYSLAPADVSSPDHRIYWVQMGCFRVLMSLAKEADDKGLGIKVMSSIEAFLRFGDNVNSPLLLTYASIETMNHLSKDVQDIASISSIAQIFDVVITTISDYGSKAVYESRELNAALSSPSSSKTVEPTRATEAPASDSVSKSSAPTLTPTVSATVQSTVAIPFPDYGDDNRGSSGGGDDDSINAEIDSATLCKLVFWTVRAVLDDENWALRCTCDDPFVLGERLRSRRHFSLPAWCIMPWTARGTGLADPKTLTDAVIMTACTEGVGDTKSGGVSALDTELRRHIDDALSDAISPYPLPVAVLESTPWEVDTNNAPSIDDSERWRWWFALYALRSAETIPMQSEYSIVEEASDAMTRASQRISLHDLTRFTSRYMHEFRSDWVSLPSIGKPISASMRKKPIQSGSSSDPGTTRTATPLSSSSSPLAPAVAAIAAAASTTVSLSTPTALPAAKPSTSTKTQAGSPPTSKLPSSPGSTPSLSLSLLPLPSSTPAQTKLPVSAMAKAALSTTAPSVDANTTSNQPTLTGAIDKDSSSAAAATARSSTAQVYGSAAEELEKVLASTKTTAELSHRTTTAASATGQKGDSGSSFNSVSGSGPDSGSSSVVSDPTPAKPLLDTSPQAGICKGNDGVSDDTAVGAAVSSKVASLPNSRTTKASSSRNDALLNEKHSMQPSVDEKPHKDKAPKKNQLVNSVTESSLAHSPVASASPTRDLALANVAGVAATGSPALIAGSSTNSDPSHGAGSGVGIGIDDAAAAALPIVSSNKVPTADKPAVSQPNLSKAKPSTTKSPSSSSSKNDDNENHAQPDDAASTKTAPIASEGRRSKKRDTDVVENKGTASTKEDDRTRSKDKNENTERSDRKRKANANPSDSGKSESKSEGRNVKKTAKSDANMDTVNKDKDNDDNESSRTPAVVSGVNTITIADDADGISATTTSDALSPSVRDVAAPCKEKRNEAQKATDSRKRTVGGDDASQQRSVAQERGARERESSNATDTEPQPKKQEQQKQPEKTQAQQHHSSKESRDQGPITKNSQSDQTQTQDKGQTETEHQKRNAKNKDKDKNDKKENENKNHDNDRDRNCDYKQAQSKLNDEKQETSQGRKRKQQAKRSKSQTQPESQPEPRSQSSSQSISQQQPIKETGAEEQSSKRQELTNGEENKDPISRKTTKRAPPITSAIPTTPSLDPIIPPTTVQTVEPAAPTMATTATATTTNGSSKPKELPLEPAKKSAKPKSLPPSGSTEPPTKPSSKASTTIENASTKRAERNGVATTSGSKSSAQVAVVTTPNTAPTSEGVTATPLVATPTPTKVATPAAAATTKTPSRGSNQEQSDKPRKEDNTVVQTESIATADASTFNSSSATTTTISSTAKNVSDSANSENASSGRGRAKKSGNNKPQDGGRGGGGSAAAGTATVTTADVANAAPTITSPPKQGRSNDSHAHSQPDRAQSSQPTSEPKRKPDELESQSQPLVPFKKQRRQKKTEGASAPAPASTPQTTRDIVSNNSAVQDSRPPNTSSRTEGPRDRAKAAENHQAITDVAAIKNNNNNNKKKKDNANHNKEPDSDGDDHRGTDEPHHDASREPQNQTNSIANTPENAQSDAVLVDDEIFVDFYIPSQAKTVALRGSRQDVALMLAATGGFEVRGIACAPREMNRPLAQPPPISITSPRQSHVASQDSTPARASTSSPRKRKATTTTASNAPSLAPTNDSSASASASTSVSDKTSVVILSHNPAPKRRRTARAIEGPKIDQASDALSSSSSSATKNNESDGRNKKQRKSGANEKSSRGGKGRNQGHRENGRAPSEEGDEEDGGDEDEEENVQVEPVMPKKGKKASIAATIAGGPIQKRSRHEPSTPPDMAMACVERVSAEEAERIRRSPLGQRPTSGTKKLIRLTDEWVYRGPFSPSNIKDAMTVQRALQREWRMVEIYKDSLLLHQDLVSVGPQDDPDGPTEWYYLRSKNVGVRDSTRWKTETVKLGTHDFGTYEIAERGIDSTGVEKLSSGSLAINAIKDESASRKIIVDLAARYLLVCGDAGFGNILVNCETKRLYGIDIEGTREMVPVGPTRLLEDLLFVKGKQPPQRQLIDVFAACITNENAIRKVIRLAREHATPEKEAEMNEEFERRGWGKAPPFETGSRMTERIDALEASINQLHDQWSAEMAKADAFSPVSDDQTSSGDNRGNNSTHRDPSAVASSSSSSSSSRKGASRGSGRKRAIEAANPATADSSSSSSSTVPSKRTKIELQKRSVKNIENENGETGGKNKGTGSTSNNSKRSHTTTAVSNISSNTTTTTTTTTSNTDTGTITTNPTNSSTKMPSTNTKKATSIVKITKNTDKNVSKTHVTDSSNNNNNNNSDVNNHNSNATYDEDNDTNDGNSSGEERSCENEPMDGSEDERAADDKSRRLDRDARHRHAGAADNRSISDNDDDNDDDNSNDEHTTNMDVSHTHVSESDAESDDNRDANDSSQGENSDNVDSDGEH